MNTLYEAVDASKELPKVGSCNFCIVDGCEAVLNYKGKRKGWQDEVSECGGKEHPTHFLRPLPNHTAISTKRLEALEKCVELLKDCINSIEYCAFNVEDKKIEDLPKGIIDSTGPVDSILISARNAKQALTNPETIK